MTEAEQAVTKKSKIFFPRLGEQDLHHEIRLQLKEVAVTAKYQCKATSMTENDGRTGPVHYSSPLPTSKLSSFHRGLPEREHL